MNSLDILISKVMARFDFFKAIPDEHKNLSVLESDIIDLIEEYRQ